MIARKFQLGKQYIVLSVFKITSDHLNNVTYRPW